MTIRTNSNRHAAITLVMTGFLLIAPASVAEIYRPRTTGAQVVKDMLADQL